MTIGLYRRGSDHPSPYSGMTKDPVNAVVGHFSFFTSEGNTRGTCTF